MKPRSKRRRPVIAAVVVSYNPAQGLKSRLESIARQCEKVFVVDNGSDPATISNLKTKAISKKIRLIELGENTGIAHAQNVGIEMAFSQGFDGVVLFDHDSEPHPDLIHELWQSYVRYLDRHGTPSIVGANIYDTNKKKYSKYPVREGVWFRMKSCLPGTDLENLLMVIASGTLISREVFAVTRGMLAGMFIDYVDWEYCLRAHALGLNVIVSGGAILRHERGERIGVRLGPITLFPLGYSHFRYYFIFRNRIQTVKRYGWRDPGYLLFEILSFCHEFLLLFFGRNRFQNILSALKGIGRGIVSSLPAR